MECYLLWCTITIMILFSCQFFSQMKNHTCRNYFLGWESTKETSSVKSHALTIRTGLRLSRILVVPQHLLRGRIMSPLPGVGRRSRSDTAKARAALQASIALQWRFQTAWRMEGSDWARGVCQRGKKLSRFSAPSRLRGPLLTSAGNDKNSTISITSMAS